MEIVSLPVESWREYRDLRLRALKEDPEAFSSAYATYMAQPDTYWQRRLQAALEGRAEWLLFARDNGQLVGMIGAYVPEASPEAATVVSVFVPREERGRGISNLLMEAMLNLLGGTGRFQKARLSVNVTQTAAIRLYERFGFTQVGREPSMTGDGRQVEQIKMELRLDPAGGGSR